MHVARLKHGEALGHVLAGGYASRPRNRPGIVVRVAGHGCPLRVAVG